MKFFTTKSGKLTKFANYLVKKLEKASGWRARAEINGEMNAIASSFSAATRYESVLDWENYFCQIQEGLDSARRLERMLKAYSK